MTNVPECNQPGSIYTRNGFVFITLDRRDEVTRIGKIAICYAGVVGIETESAAFEWHVPEFAEEEA